MFFEKRQRFKEVLNVAIGSWSHRQRSGSAVWFETENNNRRIMYHYGLSRYFPLVPLMTTVSFYDENFRETYEMWLFPWEAIYYWFKVGKVVKKSINVKAEVDKYLGWENKK